jgi:4-carboxymuconolactone decarboxylase
MARLPEILDREALSPAGQEAFDYILSTRGAVRGGLAALLSSPQVAQRVAHLGSFVRFESKLSPKGRQLVALATSCELESDYEAAAHHAGARREGVSDPVIAAVAAGKELTDADEEERLLVAFSRELVRSHRLSEATFAAAQARYGDDGVVDLLATVGYYALLAVLFNGLEIPPH